MAKILTDKKPVGFLDLPYEIRLEIYRYWFSRPIGIVPAINYYTRKLTRREKTETGKRSKRYPAYRYQWEGAINSRSLPSRYGEPRTVFPSPFSWALAWQLEIPGVFGIKLLRTCKQIHAEGCEILYGENRFVFSAGPHIKTLYEHDSHRIPGLRNEDGSPKTEQKAAATIDKIFDQQCLHHPLIWKDPLLHFFTKTGRHNASLIKSVKIIRRSWGPSQHFAEVCFPDLLRLYTLVLKEVCVDLAEVSIDAPVVAKLYQNTTEYVVRLLVEGMPGLKKLSFGDYGNVWGEQDDDPKIEEKNLEVYGVATLRWREVVRERAD
jgi:hypothetical protein